MVNLNKYMGLLRWSLNYSDGTKTNAQPMDEERRKFLMAAIEENMVDPVDQMKTIIKVLETPKGKVPENNASNSDASPEEGKPEIEAEPLSEASFIRSKVEAFEALQDFTENIDLAMDFIKIGGLDIVLTMHTSEHTEIRMKAAELLASLVQNHPKNQKIVFEKKGLDLLMNNWNNEACTSKERVKLLLGIASLVRGSNEATKEFITTYKGLPLLLKQLTNKSESTNQNNSDQEQDNAESAKFRLKLQRKILFLIQYFVTALPQIRPVISKSLVESLSVSKSSSDIDVRESSLHILKILIEDQKQG